MIDELIRHIKDNGFKIRYEYDDSDETLFKGHVFRIKKFHGEQVFQNQWIIDDDMANAAKSTDFLIMEADMRMKQVNEMITQHRLIEEALS